MYNKKFLVFCFLFLCFSLQAQTYKTNDSKKVSTGIEELLANHLDMIKGKNIGIVTNNTGILQDSSHLVDVLHAMDDVNIIALFGPEHGIRGDAADGVSIQNGVDTKTGLTVYSLYGSVRKPTATMLRGIDILIFDIQDIGARFYTYTSTMSYCMEAAAEQNIKYIVLDRPNPITGRYGGAVLNPALSSFVGLHRVSIMHGLTVGELAKLINEEGWLRNGVKADLTVIKMKGWERDMWYDETGLPWVKPSPNMMTLETATVYPGTCFIEGTTLSEGRGTYNPFELIGAPYINTVEFNTALNAHGLKGVRFDTVTFTPVNIVNVATNPKHMNARCGGTFVRVTDRNLFNPLEVGIYIIYTLRSLYPNDFRWRTDNYIDNLSGTRDLRLMINQGSTPEDVINRWDTGLQEYIKIANKYLLYGETVNINEPEELPTTYSLSQNYPNPFNPSTNFSYSLPKTSDVRIAIYDLFGREINTLVNESKEAGTYTISWNGRDNQNRQVSTGVYFYKMQATGFEKTMKMMLMK